VDDALLHMELVQVMDFEGDGLGLRDLEPVAAGVLEEEGLLLVELGDGVKVPVDVDDAVQVMDFEGDGLRLKELEPVGG
jgi:hypothetical protein